MDLLRGVYAKSPSNSGGGNNESHLVDTASAQRTQEPDISAAISQIGPNRRVEIEKRMKRKLDCTLFPTLMIIYILNNLDRNALAFARLVYIEDDLNLQGSEFATSLSIFWIGYILVGCFASFSRHTLAKSEQFQLPSNLVLSESKPSLFLPFLMCVWGIVSTSTAAVHGYGGLVTVRFFLGMVEAPFFPGALFLLSSWYKRKEIAMRYALFYGGQMLSNAFGSLIALGITERMDGVGGLQSWRWMFIIEGSITIVVAIIGVFFMPNYPHNTSWITGDERTVAVWRLIEDSDSADDDDGMWQGFVLAIKDYKVWILTFNQLFITLSASITIFYPTVVATLGFSRKITYALIAPPYLLGFVTLVYGCHHADTRGERTWHIILPLLVTLLGVIILAASLNIGARYFSLFLITCFVFIPLNCNIAWVPTCVPSPAKKRAAALAGVNMIALTGVIVASYIYPDSQAPRYWMASTIQGVSILCSIVLTLILRRLLKAENAKLDRLGASSSAAAGSESGQTEERGFRYIF